MNSLYKQAVDTWGADNQLDMAIEECAELITAIRHFKRGRCSFQKLAEEVADVEIMMDQIREIINPIIIDIQKAEKLSRLKRRLGG